VRYGLLKKDPHSYYPPEEGRYILGNYFSPVAIAVIVNRDEDKIHDELTQLVMAGIEADAALS
jgi:hypothetical protein